MNLKAIIQTVTEWFAGELQRAAQSTHVFVADKFSVNGLEISKDGGIRLATQTIKDSIMSTPAAALAASATPNANVNSAIKIALFLKALDPNLTDAAVQDATNAALAAAYPVA